MTPKPSPPSWALQARSGEVATLTDELIAEISHSREGGDHRKAPPRGARAEDRRRRDGGRAEGPPRVGTGPS